MISQPFPDAYARLSLWVPERKYPPTPHNLIGSRVVSHAERKMLQDGVSAPDDDRTFAARYARVGANKNGDTSKDAAVHEGSPDVASE